MDCFEHELCQKRRPLLLIEVELLYDFYSNLFKKFVKMGARILHQLHVDGLVVYLTFIHDVKRSVSSTTLELGFNF